MCTAKHFDPPEHAGVKSLRDGGPACPVSFVLKAILMISHIIESRSEADCVTGVANFTSKLCIHQKYMDTFLLLFTTKPCALFLFSPTNVSGFITQRLTRRVGNRFVITSLISLNPIKTHLG